MSGLCGFLGDDAATAQQRHIIASMSGALPHHPDERQQLLAAPWGAIAVSSAFDNYDCYQSEDVLAIVHGRPTATPAVLAEVRQCEGWARWLAQAYRQTGPDILRSLHGPFAVAVLLRSTHEVLLAVDRMGIMPLGYAQAGATLVFGSDSNSINNHPLIQPRLDPQGIFNYVYFHVVPSPGGIYKNQQRLLPGQYLLLKNTRLTVQHYWRLEFVEDDKRDFQRLKHDFRELLENSVQEAARHPSAGAFLSGGTDSSTVSGMLGKAAKQPANTYSIGFDAQGYDEMSYARLAASHFNTVHHEYYVTPDDVVDAVPKIAALYDTPFGNASAVPTYYCARMARADGVRLMLAGDGGDELFGGNERYAKQRLFSLYSDLPRALRKGLIEPLLFALPKGVTIAALAKARSYVEQANVAMPGRLQSYNLLNRLGVGSVFTGDFLATIDRQQPLALLEQAYNSGHAGSLINRMLALDIKFILADSDLPKVNRMCELAGVEAAYPLLDDALVAFSARLAPSLKLKGTKLRYFFKEALRDFLPNDILTKHKHGFGLPFGLWLQTHPPLRELAYDSLQALDARGFLQPGFIKRLIDTHRTGHAAYYGTLIWVLMMLELWFKTRKHPL